MAYRLTERSSIAIEWRESNEEQSYLWPFFLPSKDDVILFNGKSLKVVEILHICSEEDIITYIKCKLY